MGRIFGAANIAATVAQTRKNGTKLKDNSKYQPHQGSREIERRLKREARQTPGEDTAVARGQVIPGTDADS